MTSADAEPAEATRQAGDTSAAINPVELPASAKQPLGNRPVAEMPLKTDAAGKIVCSEDEWKARLTPEQYRVLREQGTERAFSGKYAHTKTPGTYVCAACGEKLFDSDTKFESGTGWPSFYQPVEAGSVSELADTSHGMVRTEVQCSKCGGHLGHVFNDGPNPTGLRYCINSAALNLMPDEGAGTESGNAE